MRHQGLQVTGNVFIEASAGTGKTQALGMRLLELMRAGVKAQDIVALTFSRAAAGEIFERLVSLLADGAEKGGDNARMLREVISTQHLSQIGTLDSFLLRMLRAFPPELGIFGEPEMMDDFRERREMSAVSFSILRRTDSAIKKAFVEAFSLALDGQDVRSFVETYRSFVQNWHEYVASMPDASSWGDPTRIWGRDPAFAHVTARELSAAADRLEAVFGEDQKWRDFAGWVRSFRGGLSGLSGYAGKIVGNPDLFVGDVFSFKFGRKTMDLSRGETLAVRDAMMCVFGYVVRTRLELARGIFALVSAFEREYDRKVRKAGRLVFSDVPRLIASLPEDARLALEFRTDSRIGAWALDEFQDTSREQWKALGGLVDEAKATGGDKPVFIVGDRKQAIYGWRNGDVGIFARERESGAYEKRELSRSYRSGPAVIEAVNRIFSRGRILSEFPAWKSPEHETAKADIKGFVRVMDAPGKKKEDFVEPVFTALSAAVGASAGDPRRKNLSAAVLVRTNAFGRLLADRLKAMGFEGIVWEGDSPVLDTPALSGFLDLVQLSEHPGDMLSYRHFMMTPLAAAKYPSSVPSPEEISMEMSRAFTERGLVRTFRDLRGLFPESASEAWSEFTEERFTAMLRAAAEFESLAIPDARLSDFGQYLLAKRSRTMAEDGKVKIMTIHHSKGLGFDYVVLPLYEHDPLVSEPSSPLVGDGWILPAIDARVADAVGGLGDAYRLRRDRVEQEALCTYYVAVTRAKRAITMITYPEGGSSLRFSDLVRSADLGDLANETVSLGASCEKLKGGARAAALPPPRRKPRVSLSRRLPSMSFESGTSAGSLFVKNDSRRFAMERGIAMHAEMEKVDFDERLPRPEGFVELWRERPFEVFADGEWVSGRFDRVVFFEKGGEMHAEIVDFKSSAGEPGKYDAQLAAYRRALELLSGIPPERISARILVVQSR